jgi:hypothetical protein
MFNLNNASPEVKAIARQAGIRSGKWEPVNAGESVDSLVDRGKGDTIVARVFNRNHPDGFEITAADLVDAYLLR